LVRYVAWHRHADRCSTIGDQVSHLRSDAQREPVARPGGSLAAWV
jgi:hypothetical protein